MVHVSRAAEVLVVLALLFSACKKRDLREERYPNGAMRSSGYVQQDANGNYVLVGTWTYWYPNGQKQAEGEYRNARESGKRGETGLLVDGRQGVWNFWQENGRKILETSYKDGIQDGPSSTWRQNGQKESEGAWKDGKQQGHSTNWHENGQKSSEGDWQDDKQEGLLVAWYANGQKEFEGNWHDGKQVGPFTIWHENGQKKLALSYKDGLQEGVATSWYENGQEEFEGSWKGGKGEGAVTDWYENGQMKSKGEWKDDKKEGRWTFWRKNGKKAAEATFHGGIPDGQIVGWDENGNRTAVSFKDDGLEISAAGGHETSQAATEVHSPPSTAAPVVLSDRQDTLEFGKPTVKVARTFGMVMTRVIVQAKNLADHKVDCLVTATFMNGESILGTATGTVNGVPAAGTKTAELVGIDEIKGYDLLKLETSACF